MGVGKSRIPIQPSVTLFLLFVIAIAALAVAGETESIAVPDEITQAKQLLENGEFTRAASLLEDFIASSTLTEDNYRYAYNILVLVKLQSMQADAARHIARQALRRFPDIHADIVEFPVTVNDTYDEMRALMFGSLAIAKPEGARVFIDREYVGTTPLLLEYLEAGSHEVNLSKSGFRDFLRRVDIAPGETVRLEPVMSKSKGVRYWAMRIVPVAVAGSVIVAAIAGDDTADQLPGGNNDLPDVPPPPP